MLLTYFIRLVDFDTIIYPLFITFMWGIALFFL